MGSGTDRRAQLRTTKGGTSVREEEDTQTFLAKLRAKQASLPTLARATLAGGDVLAAFAQLSQAHRDLHAQALALAVAHLEREGIACRPDVSYAFLILGSGARDEQSITSDQDHALLYDGPDDAQVDAYFTRLAEVTTAYLYEIGYALCAGNVMASNPRWRGNIRAFEVRLKGYAELPTWEHIRYLLIASDARVVAGSAALAEAVRAKAVQAVARSGFMKWKIADQGLAQRVSLTLLGQLRLETGGDHKGRLALKEGLYTPLVNSVRVFALSVGVEEPSTAARIAALVQARVFSAELAASLLQALRTTLFARVTHHLALAQSGEPLHDYVDLSLFNEEQRDELKRAHRTARTLQQLAAKQFPKGG